MNSTEVGGYATAGVVILAAFGAALKWTVTWLSGRNDKLVGDLVAETKALRQKIETLEAKVMFLGAEIAVLAAELPNPDARARASAALRKVFPVDPAVPTEFADLIRRLG